MAKSALCKNEKIKNKSDDPNQIPFNRIGQLTSIQLCLMQLVISII